MKGTRAVVYERPEVGLPYLAVVLGEDGEVLISRSAPSRKAAEALIATLHIQFGEKQTDQHESTREAIVKSLREIGFDAEDLPPPKPN